MPRQLIVNADDLGYSPGVTAGILQAHLQGIVTSTSAIVTLPGAAEALRRARAEAPALGIGLHLTLTAGQPVAPPTAIPDLTDADGRFHSWRALAPLLPRISADQIALEFRAQIDRFLELSGHLPDHLDSHHHVAYRNRVTLAALAELATEFALPVRWPDRQPASPVGDAPDLSDMIALRTRHILRTPDHFEPHFFGEQATLGDLLILLATRPEGTTELMCHPGLVDNLLIQNSSYAAPRARELAALTHSSAQELIQSEQIELVTFEAVR